MKKIIVLALICLCALVPVMYDFSDNNTTTELILDNNAFYFNKITTNGMPQMTSGKIVIQPRSIQIGEITGSVTYLIDEIVHNEKENTYSFIGPEVEFLLNVDDRILWKQEGSDSTIYHINSTIKSNW